MVSASFCHSLSNDPAPTDLYTLSLHDALPISPWPRSSWDAPAKSGSPSRGAGRSSPGTSSPWACSSARSEEHTSELQSLRQLVCRLLLEKKKYCRFGAQAG